MHQGHSVWLLYMYYFTSRFNSVRLIPVKIQHHEFNSHLEVKKSYILLDGTNQLPVNKLFGGSVTQWPNDTLLLFWIKTCTLQTLALYIWYRTDIGKAWDIELSPWNQMHSYLIQLQFPSWILRLMLILWWDAENDGCGCLIYKCRVFCVRLQSFLDWNDVIIHLYLSNLAKTSDRSFKVLLVVKVQKNIKGATACNFLWMDVGIRSLPQ